MTDDSWMTEEQKEINARITEFQKWFHSNIAYIMRNIDDDGMAYAYFWTRFTAFSGIQHTIEERKKLRDGLLKREGNFHQKGTFINPESLSKSIIAVEPDENGMIECPYCGLRFHDSEWHFCYNHTK